MKIGIVGAGIMGRLLAFECLRAGHQVHLFDQDEGSGKRSCSLAAAGLLAPVTELEKSDVTIFHMGLKAIKQYWPAIIKQLDHRIYFQTQGSIVLSHPRDKADLHRFIDLIKTKVAPLYQPLTSSTMGALEPDLTKFDEAYFFPEEAQLDSQAVLMALGDALAKKGISWHKHTFVNEVKPGKIAIQQTTLSFDLVIDCRGMGAKKTFPHLQGIRGELIWLQAPDVTITRPIRFLHPRYALYIVPRPEHIYLVGASEIHAEDDTEISVKSALELLTTAYYLHPGFSEARLLKTVTQCRPTLPDYLPRIRHQAGLIAINGLYRHGFLIAPTLAVEISQFLKTGWEQLTYPQLWGTP